MRILGLIAFLLYSLSSISQGVFSNNQYFSGWVQYSDTTYTSASPFLLTVAAGESDMPNDAGSIIDAYLPEDIIELYNNDSLEIIGNVGGAYILRIEAKVRPNGPSANPRLKYHIDIGNGTPISFNESEFLLTKGNGVEHYFLTSFNYYTLSTWAANGGKIKVQAFNEDLEIYDIIYLITAIKHPK